ncbi:phosphoprotein, partial [North Creek virus]
MKKEEILSSKGLEKVIQSIGDGGVESGNPVGPTNDVPDGCSPPKKPKTPKILQKGPSRHSQQAKPSGGSGEPGPSGDVTCAMKNLQLQRTQEYLDIESYGQDYPSPPTASDKSGSSTPTYLDTESDFDDIDAQTRAECNEMGIDPQTLHADIKELIYVPEDGRVISSVEDCLKAVNVILADTESLPGTVVTSFKFEKGSIIGLLKRSSAARKDSFGYLGIKTLEKQPVCGIKSETPIMTCPDPYPESRPTKMEMKKVVEATDNLNRANKVVTVIAPKRKGGAPFRFKIPSELYDECFDAEISKTELAKILLKKLGVFTTYRFTCDYSVLEI